MNCHVHFYLLNVHFSQEYADEHNNGQESELNLRYEWEDELSITTPVEEVVMHEQAVYPIRGVMPEGEEFSYDVKGMRLFELKSGEQSVYVGCSESILDSFEEEVVDETITLRIYLRDYEPMSNPVPGIYIAAQEFPKELIR